MHLIKYVIIFAIGIQWCQSGTINATEDQQFYGTVINCTEGEPCIVNCTAWQSCASSTINCPSEDDCYVTCRNDSSCDSSIINCPQSNGDAACQVTSVGGWPDPPFYNTIVNANYTNNPIFTCAGSGGCFQSYFYNCHASSDGTMTVYTKNNPQPEGILNWRNWYSAYAASLVEFEIAIIITVVDS